MDANIEKLVSISSRLEGLSELFNASADSVQEGKERALSYGGLVGIGDILMGLSVEVATVATGLDI